MRNARDFQKAKEELVIQEKEDKVTKKVEDKARRITKKAEEEM